MTIEAMKQALEALHVHAAPHPMVFRAMDALRLAIEQAEKPRQWRGLTKDEVNGWKLPERPTVFEFAEFVETKLKEKNT